MSKMYKQLSRISLVLGLMGFGVMGWGQISVTTLPQTFTQNFNTTVATVPTGWAFSESGSGANSSFSSGTGTANAGDTYFLGNTSEWAFGGLQSGSVTPTIGAAFINNTGGTITSLDISYTGETWRIGAPSRSDRLDFQYSTNATSLTTGTWIDVDALDYSNPGQVTGSGSVQHSLSISGIISSLSIPNGSAIWIRWTDFNASGSDDAMAIDDFTITADGTTPANPTVGFDAISSSENETNSTFSTLIPVTLSNYGSTPVALSVTLTGGIYEPGDVTLNTTSLNFSGNGTQNISLDINDDADLDDETVEITIAETSLTGANVSPSIHTLTILDDEVPPAGLQILMVSTDYTIDFDATVSEVNNGQFDGSGLQPNPSSGQLDSDAWSINGNSDGDVGFGGTGTSGDLTRGTTTGGVTSGGIYAFEVASSNFALGAQSTGSDMAPGSFTLRIQNSTGNTLESIILDYNIYVYNDQGRSSFLNFSWSTDNSSYTDVTSLNFTTPEAADGPPTWVSTPRGTSFNVTLNEGDFLYLRWNIGDVGGGGSRDELAIDDIVFRGETSPLPVDLLSFTATPREKQVHLDWTFDNARGFDRFAIEHATDRQEWSEIGVVHYTETISRSKQAQYTHTRPANGNNYYRLRMIDEDGSEKLSRVQSVQLRKSGGFTPVNTLVDAELIVTRSGSDEAAQLTIVDLQGRVMETGILPEFEENAQMNMSGLAPGVYLLQVVTSSDRTTFKVVKK